VRRQAADYGGVSIETTLARVAEIQRALTFAPPPQAAPPPVAAVATTSASGGTGFQAALTRATAAGATVAPLPAGPGGAGILAAARGELGVTEQPPGSNDSPRIATYRSAAGSPGPGPWCAYFVSWCARQAGAPIGPGGSGFGSVDAVWAWAEQAGRTSQQPRPGDLVVWDEHIGIVEAVLPDGSIQTIEGNTSDTVARREHPVSGVVGFVRMS
jgi:hypothetical protein